MSYSSASEPKPTYCGPDDDTKNHSIRKSGCTIPAGENAVANPASQEQPQHSAAVSGLEASGVTGGRDRQPLPGYPSRTLQMESGRYVPWDDWLDMRCRAGQLEQEFELADRTCLEYCELAGELAAFVEWVVARDGECVGDHPQQLAYAQRILKKAKAKRDGQPPSNQERTVTDNRDAYRVEENEPGCPACYKGGDWLVVGPDDVATGTIYHERDDAEDMARALNDAYCEGRAGAFKDVARRTGPENRRDESKDWFKGGPDERRKSPGRRKTDDDIPF